MLVRYRIPYTEVTPSLAPVKRVSGKLAVSSAQVEVAYGEATVPVPEFLIALIPNWLVPGTEAIAVAPIAAMVLEPVHEVQVSVVPLIVMTYPPEALVDADMV